MATTMNQALEMAQKLNVEILSENGEYKFRPEIRLSIHTTVYIHANNAAIQASKNGLEWSQSRHYTKQQYQVRESSIRFHTFPTIPALCTWLKYEAYEKAIREGEEIAKEEAQKRADKEQDTVYVIRVIHSGMMFTRTYEEIAQTHATDSIHILHTANPTSKPTPEEIAANAKPGDMIVSLNCNGQLRESTFKYTDPDRGVVAEFDGEIVIIRFDKIRALKKATPNNEPKDGKDVANDAKPGDTVIYDENGAEYEGRFYDMDAHGAMVWDAHNVLIVVKFDHILGLKKSGSTPDPDQPASEQTAPDGLTDQEYTALQQKIMNFDLTTGSTDEILKDMATLHFERERRTMEFFSGKRSRRSVQSRQVIACRDALQVKLGYRISLNKRGVYARSQWQ